MRGLRLAKAAWRPWLIASTILTIALPVLAGESLPKPDRVAADPTPEQSSLIREGVALHDQRNYEAAAAKYRQVLEQNPWEVNALHELAFTYFESKKYEDAIRTARLGAQCRSKALPYFHMMIANALDELGRGKEAIETYRAAIKQSPGAALLHYNLSIALRKAGKQAEAKSAAQRALERDPDHPSSHAVLGAIYQDMGYRVPAILAYSRFLMLEPESQRALQTIPKLEQLLTGGVSRGKEANQINILLSASPKARVDEGDFGPTELMTSVTVAAGLIAKPGEVNSKPATPFDRLVTLYTGIGESLKNSKPKKGFAATYYAPYFVALQQSGHAEAFVAYAWSAGRVPGATEWLKANDAKIGAMKAWSASFHWPGK